MDRNPWGKRDFIPGMNFVEIAHVGSVSGNPVFYGSPERRKVSSVDQITKMGKANIAYGSKPQTPTWFSRKVYTPGVG